MRDSTAGQFKALGHSDRLRIVEILAAGPKTVGEISATMGQSINVVSRNLRVLRDGNVVRCSRRGNRVLYVLADRNIARMVGLAYRAASGQVRRTLALPLPTADSAD